MAPSNKITQNALKNKIIKILKQNNTQQISVDKAINELLQIKNLYNIRMKHTLCISTMTDTVKIKSDLRDAVHELNDDIDEKSFERGITYKIRLCNKITHLCDTGIQSKDKDIYINIINNGYHKMTRKDIVTVCKYYLDSLISFSNNSNEQKLLDAEHALITAMNNHEGQVKEANLYFKIFDIYNSFKKQLGNKFKKIEAGAFMPHMSIKKIKHDVNGLISNYENSYSYKKHSRNLGSGEETYDENY